MPSMRVVSTGEGFDLALVDFGLGCFGLGVG